MQKDIHFYTTYALARKAGVAAAIAEKIAWADQYTDDLKDAKLHGIQTQSGLLDNWGDRQIQLSVLVPFHFIPGSSKKYPWMTTAGSKRAAGLATSALKAGPIRLGIALHVLQDTFSHQGFSGWREELNSCYSWYYVESRIPNVGHAELLVAPDIANNVWTDPRNGSQVDNKPRALAAAKATFAFLVKSSGKQVASSVWQGLQRELQSAFKMTSYDKRIDKLCALSGNSKIDYAKVDKRLAKKHGADFVEAASNHLAAVMESLSGLPRLK